MSIGLNEVDVPEEFITSVKYDIQTLITLLDAEVQNPQLLHHDRPVCVGSAGH